MRNTLKRGFFAAATVAGALGVMPAAFAAPIIGTFSLVADEGVLGGQTVATGLFVTQDTDTDTIQPYSYTFPANPVLGLPATTVEFDNAIALQSFNLVSNFPNAIGSFSYTFAGFDDASDPNDADDGFQPNPVGVVSGVGANTVLGLFGTGVNDDDPDNVFTIQLTFDENNGVQGTFTSSLDGNVTDFSVSGNQYIPEPNALALMGAGMLAFGVARVRRRRQG